MQRNLTFVCVVIFLVLGSNAAFSQCNSTPIAVDDDPDHYGFTIAFDALENDSEPDGQALTLQIVNSTCSGPVSATANLIIHEPVPFAVAQACSVTYRVTDPLGLSDTAQVQFQANELPIFDDDFGSGDASAWSGCTPTPCP